MQQIYSALNKLKTWAKGIRKEKTHHSIEAAHLAHLPEALERDRGMAHAQTIGERSGRKHAEDKLAQRGEVNFNKELQAQAKMFKFGHLEGALSLRKMFRYQEKALKSKPQDIILGKKRRPIRCMSEDFGMIFGHLWDIQVTRSGETVLIIEDAQGNKKPFTAGSFKELLRNYKTLREGAMAGQLVLNANSDGSYAPDVYDVVIPRVIVGLDGKASYNQSDKRPFRAFLKESNEQINDMHRMGVAARREAEMQAAENDALSTNLEVTTSTLEMKSASNEALKETLKGIQGSFHHLAKDFAEKSFKADISETEASLLSSQLESTQAKHVAGMDKDDQQKAIEAIREAKELFADTGGKTTILPVAMSLDKATKKGSEQSEEEIAISELKEGLAKSSEE